MDYKQTTALYLGAALYRERLERRCRRGDEWVLGTYALLYLELMENLPDVASLDVYAVQRYQKIVEVARAYFAAQPDVAQIRDIVELVRSAMHKAADRLKTLPRNQSILRMEEMRVFLLASNKMSSDLKQIHSGA